MTTATATAAPALSAALKPRRAPSPGQVFRAVARAEYATGQIRATLGATPRRVTVLAAKALTFVVGGRHRRSGFLLRRLRHRRGHLRREAHRRVSRRPWHPARRRRRALYLAAVGALGLGLGTILRCTAGAIAALVGLLLVIPLATTFLPAAWNDHLTRYLPAQAGMALIRVVPDATSLSPWTGFAVLVSYAALSLAVGGLLLTRRDA